MTAEDDEHVLVVPRERRSCGEPAGLGVRTDGIEAFVAAVERERPLRRRGRRWRRTRRFKQVIPYLVLRDGERCFLMRRTRAGGDAPAPRPLVDRGRRPPEPGRRRPARAASRREWAEELVADFVPEFRLVGLLNDDTTAGRRGPRRGSSTSRTPPARPVAIRETDKLERRLRRRPTRSPRSPTDLETWSRLVFDFLDGRVADGSAHG